MDNPQGDTENGMDYMSRIGSYKVVQALWEKCRSAGKKPTQFLGKSSLLFAWPVVYKSILGDETSTRASVESAKTSEELLRSFIDGFGALIDQGESSEATDAGSDAALVWASSVKQALGARQEARQTEAAERIKRASTADSFADELRAGLASAGDPAEPAGPIIEEVTD